MKAMRWSTCARTGSGTKATCLERGMSFSTRSSPTRPQTSSATGRSSCAPSVSDLLSPPKWPWPLASTTSSASAAGRRPGRPPAFRWRLHERADAQMTLTDLGCPMAADVMADVRDHLLTLPGVKDAGVDIVYEPVWTPERMSEEARWELGMV